MKRFFTTLLFFITISPTFSQPQPGDVFREYVWIPSMVKSEGGKFLRVGGKLDYKINFGHFPKERQDNGYIPFGHYLQLDKATKAEVVLEKVGSHEDTKNLRISINQHPSIKVPDAQGIPEPQADYMHHYYPVVDIPLEYLKVGIENSFRLDVDTAQRWNWPQNIIYGVVLRVYYKPDEHQLQTKIAGVSSTGVLDEEQILGIENPDLNIRKVEYVGYYDEINYEGDGLYEQWHYHYYRGQVVHHIGTANMYPFQVTWNTSWIPDQKNIKVAARIVGNNGMIYFSEPTDGLTFERDYTVELCKPYDQPKNWVTRQDEFSSKIDVNTDPKSIKEARIYWVSWSPGYANGIYINDTKVFDKEGPHYEYMAHEIEIEDPSILKKGTNIIKTGKEPLHDGQMVHGMEVQWPGIMMKVKTGSSSKFKASVTEYEGRAHFLVEAKNVTYYYDIKGGGFSRIIDQNGNDWINFKMKPWGEYPAAAASSFRGMPNMVFQDADDGAGHPGHDKCTSYIQDSKIITESFSGKWKWSWEFGDSHVVLDVIKTDPDRAFWFLYEGTPGGKFDPENTYFGTDVLSPRKLSHDYYKGDVYRAKIKWMYVGTNNSDQTLYFVHQTGDDFLDMASLLGNSDEGIDSEDGMTVFGFGRGEGVERNLKGRQKFVIGIYPKKIDTAANHAEFATFVGETFL